MKLSALYLALFACSASAIAPNDQVALGTTETDSLEAPLLAKKPLVSSEALQATVNIGNLFKRARKLFEAARLSEGEYGHPTRVIGSAGHNQTLAYVYSELEKLSDYYNISYQSFPAVSGNVFDAFLVLNTRLSPAASPMGLTPPTKNNKPVSGDLVLVKNNGCDPADYPASVKGNIAFVRRGTCSFGQKSQLAGRAGATAAVIFNNENGDLHGTLGTPSPDHIATFGLTGEAAAPLLEDLDAGKEIYTIAFIDSEVKSILTQNIIAQTVSGDPDNCVMLGGHSDSVAEGPGINDDGSGSITVLELAVQLAAFEVNNCVRFAWWSGEEEGLLGSDYYVSVLPDEENLKIRLFMDYDMMASPNFAYQIYNATDDESPAGSQALRDLYVSWYESQGLNYTFIPFDGRSDYDGFIRGGIPAGGIATGAEGVKTTEEVSMFGGIAGEWYDPCYHQLCDGMGNVNKTAWVVNTKLVAHSIATYAQSFEGFPNRTLQEFDAASKPRYEPRYHGSKLLV